MGARAAERTGHYAGRAGHYAGKAGNLAASAAGVKKYKENLEAARDFARNPTSLKKGAALAGKTAKNAASTALVAFGVPKGLSDKGLDIVTSKKFWIYLSIILFALFFWLFDATTFDVPQTQNGSHTPTTSDVCTPPSFPSEAAAFNQTSVCTITVTYAGSAQDITIIDTTLPGTEYVSSSPKGDVTQELGAPGIHGIQQPTGTSIITWDAQKLNLPLNPVNITVTVTIRITTKTDNTIVYNAYDINPVGLTTSSGGGSTGGNVPANKDTCGGKYTLTNPLGNFGDPQCNFTRQALDTQLNQADPGNAMTWDCIAYYESTDDPNAYNGNSTSGKGAYGLFQMNPPGKGNNQFDNGGVNYPVQTSNAINYNRGIGDGFLYWGTYYTNGGPCH